MPDKDWQPEESDNEHEELVANISTVDLTEDLTDSQKMLLSKGLSFCPIYNMDWFKLEMKNEITKLCRTETRGRIHDNLSKQERATLSELVGNGSITIKPANKGKALVVMNTKQYVQEIHNQLNDEAVYEKLTKDPTDECKSNLHTILGEFKDEGILDDRLHQFLVVECPTIPILYILPKIHKNLERPPGR